MKVASHTVLKAFTTLTACVHHCTCYSCASSHPAAPLPHPHKVAAPQPSRAVWHEAVVQLHHTYPSLLSSFPRRNSTNPSLGEKGNASLLCKVTALPSAVLRLQFSCPLLPLSLTSDHIKVTINFSVWLVPAPHKHHLSPPSLQRQGSLAESPTFINKPAPWLVEQPGSSVSSFFFLLAYNQASHLLSMITTKIKICRGAK